MQGKFSRYLRSTHLGGTFESFFCPDCGSTVYMRGSKNADLTGIPIGAFVDPHQMVPLRSVWERSKHEWVTIATAVQHFEMGRS